MRIGTILMTVFFTLVFADLGHCLAIELRAWSPAPHRVAHGCHVIAESRL